MLFHHVVKSVTSLFSLWCGTWWCLIDGFLPVIVSFFFLFSLSKQKCIFLLFSFYFSILFLGYLLLILILYSLENFLMFLILFLNCNFSWIIVSNSVLFFFNFWFFFYDFFKSFVVFNFIIRSKFMLFIFKFTPSFD